MLMGTSGGVLLLGQRLGPWCYTKDPSVTMDICDIPLCASKVRGSTRGGVAFKSSDQPAASRPGLPSCRICRRRRAQGCRMTGPGMEYAGDVKRSASGHACLEWSGLGKFRRDNPAVGKYSGRLFADSSVRWAGRKCRNPDAWPGGPWCFVRAGSSGAGRRVERAHCDVPACEPRECTVFTAYEEAVHSDFTALPAGASSLSLRFGVRLWDPGDWKTARARIALSLLVSPGSGRQLLDRKVVTPINAAASIKKKF